jgi:hypothetical protein
MAFADAINAGIGLDFDEGHLMALHSEPHHLHVGDLYPASLLRGQTAERGNNGAAGSVHGSAFKKPRRYMRDTLSGRSASVNRNALAGT